MYVFVISVVLEVCIHVHARDGQLTSLPTNCDI